MSYKRLEYRRMKLDRQDLIVKKIETLKEDISVLANMLTSMLEHATLLSLSLNDTDTYALEIVDKSVDVTAKKIKKAVKALAEVTREQEELENMCTAALGDTRGLN